VNQTWGALLTLLPFVLAALVLLLPVVACLRSPRTVPWQTALALVLAGLFGTLLLSLGLSVLLQALSSAWPGLNPMQTPAHEPVEAGLFVLLLSLILALAFTALGQWLYLRSRRESHPKETL
jgi:hypothetical protein